MKNTIVVEKRNGKQNNDLEWISKATIITDNGVGSDSSNLKQIDNAKDLTQSSDNNKKSKRSSLVVFFSTIFNWLNGSNSSEIDVNRMERRNDQQLGIRKWNL
jgi:hypothetical protein